MYRFSGIVLLTLVQKNVFFIKKSCTYDLSDQLCEYYREQEYLEKGESTAIQTHLQKIIPETVSDLLTSIKQGIVHCYSGDIRCWVWYFIDPLAVIVCMLVTITMLSVSSRVLARTPEVYKKFVEGTQNVRRHLLEQIHNREIGSFLRSD